MADVTIKRTEEFENKFGAGFRLARHGLGVTSFGMQVLEMPANADRYPEHNHDSDGQEEVYTALEGKAKIRVGGEEHTLEPGIWARIGPQEQRYVWTEDNGATLLVIGGIPGQSYSIPEYAKPD